MQQTLDIARAPKSRGMGAHHSGAMQCDEWLTPLHLLDALGPFDLDPCAPRVRPWSMAARHYTITDNGLAQPWQGRVWLNPPYGSEAAKWLQRMAQHNNGTALLFARTETAVFHDWIWQHATALLFLRGRLHFHFMDGTRAPANSGAPSVLIAYGPDDACRLAQSGIEGKLVYNTG